ncbi:MAG TPA: hypothetical protein VN641_18835 [Urbifossiella sp.]|nr:hypothetical protein [Urbifossiella sp.]
MAIEFVCPSCQGALRVPDESAGQVMRCGNCLTALRVPSATPSDPEPVEPREVPEPRELERRPRRDDRNDRNDRDDDFGEPARRPRRESRDDRDDFGEPRPRRRTAKKGGKSVLFWLVIIIFGLGLFTCLACGGIWFAMAIPRWQTHESQAGGYKVDLPAPLNPGINQEVKLKQPNEHVEGTVLAGRLEVYWVGYHKVDLQALLAGDEAILKATVEGFTKENLGTVIRETPKTVDGYPAREVVLVHEGLTTHCIIVAARATVYVAAVSGPFLDADGNERTRRFLDSFHILKKDGPKKNPFRGEE